MCFRLWVLTPFVRHTHVAFLTVRLVMQMGLFVWLARQHSIFTTPPAMHVRFNARKKIVIFVSIAQNIVKNASLVLLSNTNQKHAKKQTSYTVRWVVIFRGILNAGHVRKNT